MLCCRTHDVVSIHRIFFVIQIVMTLRLSKTSKKGEWKNYIYKSKFNFLKHYNTCFGNVSIIRRFTSTKIQWSEGSLVGKLFDANIKLCNLIFFAASIIQNIKI
jgi:hypothetical protein